MEKVLICIGVLPMTFGFIQSVMPSVQSVKTVKSETTLENMENLELEKRSENIMDENEKEHMEFKKFFSEEYSAGQNSINKYENLVQITDNYIQRYISLFLITSNLLNHEVKDPNEMITIDLEISISGEDLAYLQHHLKNVKSASKNGYLRNFSKLDAIFSNIARLKERSYVEDALKSSRSFFASLNIFSALNCSDFYHFFPLLIIFFVSKAVHHFIFHKTFFIFVGIFMNSLIFWESLQLYWKKVKESGIEIYVKTLQSNGVPEDCDPEKVKWYQSLLNLFLESKCLQYYKTINQNPVEEVSLFKCIIDTYSFYLIQTPFRIFGASIRDFMGEISALWPWPFRYIINIPFAPFFVIVAIFFILILCGKRLRFSFFGTGIEIGDVKTVIEKEKYAITNCEIPRTVRIVRKLKPWTKSRFPKRLDVDLERRRKLHLKASKSVPQEIAFT